MKKLRTCKYAETGANLVSQSTASTWKLLCHIYSCLPTSGTIFHNHNTTSFPKHFPPQKEMQEKDMVSMCGWLKLNFSYLVTGDTFTKKRCTIPILSTSQATSTSLDGYYTRSQTI